MTEFEPRTSGIRSYCSTNWATTTAHKDELYGPDLVKFHHFDQYLKIFGNIFKVYLVLGKIFSSLWYNLYAFGKFVLLKMAKYCKHNLVTLMGIKTFFNFSCSYCRCPRQLHAIVHRLGHHKPRLRKNSFSFETILKAGKRELVKSTPLVPSQNHVSVSYDKN